MWPRGSRPPPSSGTAATACSSESGHRRWSVVDQTPGGWPLTDILVLPQPAASFDTPPPSRRCNNQTSLWQQLKADPELLSIHTSVTEARRTNQVRSQVTFFKPQHTTVRCKTTNQEGLIDFRDVKLVSSCKCPLDFEWYRNSISLNYYLETR